MLRGDRGRRKEREKKELNKRKKKEKTKEKNKERKNEFFEFYNFTIIFFLVNTKCNLIHQWMENCFYVKA